MISGRFWWQYQKAIWLGFIIDQKSTLDLIVDIVIIWTPYSFEKFQNAIF